MPSRLARRNFQAQRFIRSVMGEEQLSEQVIAGRAPWQGYTPDLSSHLITDLSFASDSTTFMESGGKLLPATGWEAYDAADGANKGLPLGSSWTSGSGASTARPVHRLDTFPRAVGGGGLTRIELVAVVVQNANMFRFNPDAGPAQWEEIAPTVADTGDLSLGTSSWPDSFVFSPGVPGTVDEPVFVLCSPDDNVKFYPEATSGNSYEDLIQTGGSGPTNFKARSGTNLAERVLYLHTEEGGTIFPRRLRFSVVGNAADVADASIGAGTIDAVELQGEGQLVRTLGDQAVGYFSDGIVFYRRTGNALAPLEIEYLSKSIGLLGRHAQATITGDLHFIVTNQGWFLLNSTGEMREVGRLDLGGGQSTRKWTETWFNLLNWNAVDKIQVVFNPRERACKVAFPTGTSTNPDTVWNWRIDTDTVWPDDYHESGAGKTDVTPTAWGVAPAGLLDQPSWSDQSTTWQATPGSWVDYTTQVDEELVFHGTQGGYVFIHRPGLVSRAQEDDTSVLPTCVWESHKLPLGDPREWKRSQSLEVEHVNQGGADATLVVESHSSASATRSLQVRPSGESSVAYFSPVTVGGTHHSVKVSAPAPCELRSLVYRYRRSLGRKGPGT